MPWLATVLPPQHAWSRQWMGVALYTDHWAVVLPGVADWSGGWPDRQPRNRTSTLVICCCLPGAAFHRGRAANPSIVPSAVLSVPPGVSLHRAGRGSSHRIHRLPAGTAGLGSVAHTSEACTPGITCRKTAFPGLPASATRLTTGSSRWRSWLLCRPSFQQSSGKALQPV